MRSITPRELIDHIKSLEMSEEDRALCLAGVSRELRNGADTFTVHGTLVHVGKAGSDAHPV